jgi:6-phosphogluconolactonase
MRLGKRHFHDASRIRIFVRGYPEWNNSVPGQRFDRCIGRRDASDLCVGGLRAFSINAETGALTPISASTFPIQGFGGCTLSIDPKGQFLYIADSTGVWGFTLNSTTGVLSAMAGSPFSDGSVLRESAMAPSGKFLYAFSNNTTLNTMSVFTINSSNGSLTPIAGSPFPMAINGTAYSIVVHPSGKLLYVSFPQTEQVAA